MLTQEQTWFPANKIGRSAGFVFDSVQSDFDEQAGQFPNIDVTYTQLSGGHFKGRLFSVNLGKVSIYIESCNQAIEKEVTLSPNEFALAVVLDDETQPPKYGIMRSNEIVHILPPSGESVTISPSNSVIMFMTIDREALAENGLLLSDASEWLSNLDKQGEFVNSLRLANRLRSEVSLVLEAVEKAKTPESRSKIAEMVIFSVATAFTLEWLKPNTPKTFDRTMAYERYRYLRDLLRGRNRTNGKIDGSALELGGSKRSIELAFSELVSMGPLTYSRVARLHNARRKLMDRSRLAKNIGDIAAEEGFWDWSKFSTYYRRQFGELPSHTRDRLTQLAS